MEKKKVTIVTHDGKYHPDDVFAVASLELLLEKDNECTVVRTRDKGTVEAGDFVVDVGSVYDEQKNRFDHHQNGGAGKRENGIPYASFGLVWKTYGEEICEGNTEVAKMVDQKLVQPIDVTDNGIEVVNSIFENIYPYTIYDYFDALSPSWKEDNVNLDQVFSEVVLIAKKILVREIKKTQDKLESKDIIFRTYENSIDKRVILFDKEYPVNQYLTQLPEPLLSIAPRSDGTWTLKTVRNDSHQFIDRKPLPEAWAGKRDEDLEKASGVKGAVFCTNGRFLAVAKTKEAALELARIALNS